MKNKLFYGDCLEILEKYIPDNYIDLIYIDPPYNSKRNYNIIYQENIAQTEAFSDTWSLKNYQEHKDLIFVSQPVKYKSLHKIFLFLEAVLINSNPNLFGYLITISLRLVELHRVLKDTGSFYIHIDPKASHYIKIILDQIFGHKNFINEIVWCYSTSGRSKNSFAKKHDVILFYSKNKNYFWNNEESKIPYSKEYISSHFKDKDNKNNICRKRIDAGKERIYYPETGMIPNDWWEIPYINSQAKERLGYPTQKPLELMERIIKSSSNKGQIVLDAFCGCGTTITACQKLKRKWIGIDITFLAIDVIKARLLNSFYKKFNKKESLELFNKDIEILGIPKDIQAVKDLLKKGSNRKEFEKWAILSIGAIPLDKMGSDKGIDGYFMYNDKGELKQGVIQVKSGKTGVSQIRDFSHVIDREKAKLGIFITLNSPTKGMIEEINRMPKIDLQNKKYKKIIIVEVKDILNNKEFSLPIIDKKYKISPKVKNEKRLFKE